MTIGEAITAVAHWIWTIKLTSILSVGAALFSIWCFSRVINWRDELVWNEALANQNRFWRIVTWLSTVLLGVMSAGVAIMLIVLS